MVFFIFRDAEFEGVGARYQSRPARENPGPTGPPGRLLNFGEMGRILKDLQAQAVLTKTREQKSTKEMLHDTGVSGLLAKGGAGSHGIG